MTDYLVAGLVVVVLSIILAMIDGVREQRKLWRR